MTKAKINSRNKGASAEREFAGLLFDQLGVRLVRNLDQCRGGGHDLVVAEGQEGPVTNYLNQYAIEIKRHAVSTPAKIADWWEQANFQAENAKKRPLLAHRADRGQWRVLLPVVDSWAEVSIDTFIVMARECLMLSAVDA